LFDFNFDKDFDQSLEDVFSFDLDKVADAVRRGVDKEELQQIIEESMAASFEAAIAEHAVQLPDLDEVSPLMAGDLAGRMTPPSTAACDLAGRMTPPNGTAVQSHQPQNFANCLVDALANPGMRRRSSIGTIATSRRLSVAMQAACTKHRQSLMKVAELEAQKIQEADHAGKDDGGKVTAEIRNCVLKADRRRRQSILKAAEVLEVAGLGKDSDDEAPGASLTNSEVSVQLQVVQEAVELAQKRHRQSISFAIRNVEQLREETADVGNGELTARERIERSVAAAHNRCQNSERKYSKYTSENGVPRHLRALMNTRASVAGRNVHCGGLVKPTKRNKKVRGGG
jgi:hypothetical protein